MANELKVMPRRFDQPIIGDKMQMQGSHVRSGTDNRVSVGNSSTYTVTEGVDYLHLKATAALWYRLSPDGSNAEAGKDEFLATGETVEVAALYDGNGKRRIKPGDIIKCVVDA